MARMTPRVDPREIMSGKDGRLFVEFNGENVPFAEAVNFTLTENVAEVTQQFSGDIQMKHIPTSVDYTLTITEALIRDDIILLPMMDHIKQGLFPYFNFQIVLYKPGGQEQRTICNNCVPAGNFTMQNVTPGEMIQRELNFALNDLPEVISTLTSIYM